MYVPLYRLRIKTHVLYKQPCIVLSCDTDVPKRDPMNLFARNRPDPVFTDDDDYRIERTPGVVDPNGE